MNEQYKCHDCGRTFDEPLGLREPDGLDTPPYRYSFCCPYCRSDNFGEPKYKCDCCEETIYTNEPYYELSSGERYCNDCITERMD